MKYNLRSLMVVVLVGPPLLALGIAGPFAARLECRNGQHSDLRFRRLYVRLDVVV